MEDRERIQTLCREICSRIREAMRREDGRVYADISSLVHELSSPCHRLGMKHSPLESELIDGKTWLSHRDPEQANGSRGFVVRTQFGQVDDSHRVTIADWSRVCQTLERWGRWINSGMDLRTGRFRDPIMNGDVKKPDTRPDTENISHPQSPDVRDLIAELAKELPKGRSRTEIALGYTGGNESKAQSLLRECRRFKHLYEPTGQ